MAYLVYNRQGGVTSRISDEYVWHTVLPDALVLETKIKRTIAMDIIEEYTPALEQPGWRNIQLTFGRGRGHCLPKMKRIDDYWEEWIGELILHIRLGGESRLQHLHERTDFAIHSLIYQIQSV